MPGRNLLSPLSVLGFSARDETLYRILLRRSPTTYDALAGLVGEDVRRVAADVERFVAAGLVDVRGGAVVALPPEEALARLITDESQRLRSVQEQLVALEGMLPSLGAEHRVDEAPQGRPVGVELVEGGDVVRLIRELTAAGTGDLMWLRPDQWRLPEGADVDGWVRELLAGGRRSRVIYPARVLEEAPEVVRQRAAMGEHVRILAEVPTRLAIMGSSAAMISETFGVPDARRLVVRQHSIVGALTMLFESLWERALAVPGMESAEIGVEGATGRRLLLDQLAAGAKDEQIARTLGMSLRTVRRRVAELLDELGADSRFQAGVEAVRRGWV
jgi:DNA-binding Lrp family transcriptional regulator